MMSEVIVVSDDDDEGDLKYSVTTTAIGEEWLIEGGQRVRGGAFKECNGTVRFLGRCEIEAKAFYGSGVERVYFDSSMEEVPYGCFRGCKALTYFSGKGVKRVRGSGFADSGVNVVEMANVEEFEDYVFGRCLCLMKANFPKVLDIGSAVFKDCNNLRAVNIWKVKRIEGQVFMGCVRLCVVRVRPEIVGLRAFYLCGELKQFDLGYVRMACNGSFQGSGVRGVVQRSAVIDGRAFEGGVVRRGHDLYRLDGCDFGEALRELEWPAEPQETYSRFRKPPEGPGKIYYSWYGLKGGVPDYTFSHKVLRVREAPEYVRRLMERIRGYVPDIFDYEAVLANHCLEDASLGEHKDNEGIHKGGDIVSLSFTADREYERRFYYVQEDGEKVHVPLLNGSLFVGRLDLLAHGLMPPLKAGRSESIVLTFRRVRCGLDSSGAS